jgi:hypothetical protein
MSDTHPDALRVWLDLQKRLTPGQKLRQVAEMYDTITALQTADERGRDRQASERQFFLRVAARRLGPELMKKVYEWEPGD